MTDASVSMDDRSDPLRSASRTRGVRPGLRVQILLALAGLMLLAFVPLFVAVASLARATVAGAREQAGRLLVRSIAAHAHDAWVTADAEALTRTLERHLQSGEVDVVCVFGNDGSRLACAGAPLEANALRAPAHGTETTTHAATGHALEIASPYDDIAVVARTRAEGGLDASRSLVRLVALYMMTFGLALLVFAYFVLTHLIVRPIERLVASADRVANGARTLRVPRVGARELVELATSVHSMAQKLIAEEAALILKVEELTQTASWLRDAQNQLVRSERLASVGRLVAGFAHEVGNPLAALLGMEELLLAGDLSREDQTDFLRRMRSETERIHAVVRDLLDFARPEQKEAPSDAPLACTVVRAVVDEVVALVARQPAFRSVRIETDVETSVRVNLPARRLTQVLLNVLLNAGAAIASGGSHTGTIQIRARAIADGFARIEIDDDGPGVAPNVRESLFEPFVTTKEVGAGSGLGLAVCRGLVEAAGGEVGVDVSHRAGARFYIVLPSPSG
ncbi:MAG: HAMP domain-containing histidine kinase [Myxococcota bacterium]|nr:HAMP domain-containing histidine kinase [Myxococcota bacterium]